MRTLAVLVATPLIAIGLAQAAIHAVGEPPRSDGKPTALVWGGRVFTEEGEFAAWLAERNVRYEVWRDRHPGAAPWDRSGPQPAPPGADAAGGGDTWRERSRSALETIAPVARPIASVGLLWPLTAAALLALAVAARRGQARLVVHAPGGVASLSARARDAFLEAGAGIRAPADGPRLRALALQAASRVGTRLSALQQPSSDLVGPRSAARPRRWQAARAWAPQWPATPPRPSLALPRLRLPSGLSAPSSARAPDPEPAPLPVEAASAPDEPPVAQQPTSPEQPNGDRAAATDPPPGEGGTPPQPLEGEPRATRARTRRAQAPTPPARRRSGRRRRKRAQTDTVLCEIEIWHGYVKAQLYAAVAGEDRHAIAISPMFRRRGLVEGPTDAARLAHAALVEELLAAGWEPDGQGEAWYSSRFLRPVDDRYSA